MKKSIFPLAMVFLIACKDSGQTSDTSSSSLSNTSKEVASAGSGSDSMGSGGPTEPHANSVSRCYLYAANKDTIRMRLTQTGQSVSGQLDYDWAEKDANTGSFNGEMRGDTLVADYSFKSEGKVLLRQEVMLRQGGDFLIGSGATNEQNGKPVFTDIKNMKFDNLRLTLVNCNQ